MDDEDSMTVAELLAALEKLPKDALVFTEGCDCDGDAHYISVNDDGSIMLCRSFRGGPPKGAVMVKGEKVA